MSSAKWRQKSSSDEYVPVHNIGPLVKNWCCNHSQTKRKETMCILYGVYSACSCTYRSTYLLYTTVDQYCWMYIYIYIHQLCVFIAATKQLYGWFSPSVRPSVRLSVTPFWLCSHHCVIAKLSGFITNGRSDVHANGQGQKSKVKVTEAKPNLAVSGPANWRHTLVKSNWTSHMTFMLW